MLCGLKIKYSYFYCSRSKASALLWKKGRRRRLAPFVKGAGRFGRGDFGMLDVHQALLKSPRPKRPTPFTKGASTSLAPDVLSSFWCEVHSS